MILITGATGFVGSKLVERLAANNPRSGVVVSVRCLDRHWPIGVQPVKVGNLLISTDWHTALQGIDVVVHCAARAHVMKETLNDPLKTYRQVNVAGTLNLARQAAESGVRRFVFISSIKVNGETTGLNHPFTADDTPSPRDPYGLSKMEAEQGLRELSALTGMEVIIIRPPLVYGPRVKANFAFMMKLLKKNIPLPFGSITTNRRSLVYVENLVDLIRVCIDHPNAANQTFLVSDEEDVSTAMLLRRMSKALGCQARLFDIPSRIIVLAAKIIHRPSVAYRLCGSLQVDIRKTKELLGWRPRFSMDEGLRETAEYMVNNLKR